MTEIIFAVVAAVVLAAAVNWRWGLYAVVVMALLQDVFRKLMPGEPVYFVVLSGVVFAAACISAAAQGVSLSPTSIPGWRRYLAAPFAVFVFILALQAARGYATTGSYVAVAIGLLTYLAAIPAVMFGYQFAARLGFTEVRRVILFYAVCVTVAAASLYLEYTGVDWAILGQVGEGLQIYDRAVGALTSVAGVFRSSEIAAWHIGGAICFLALLAAMRRLTLSSALMVAAIVMLLLIGTVTGRRKLYVEVALFVAVFFSLATIFGRGAIKTGLLVACVGLLTYGALSYYLPRDAEPEGGGRAYSAYLERSASVSGDTVERFENLGIAPIYWAYRRAGLLGAGLGTGSQGASQFGGGGFGGAAEGGLGKITLELGIPGLVVAGWLAVASIGLVLRLMRSTVTMPTRVARLSYGLVGFLVANAATFAVATQVFADPSVLIILGISAGFLLAAPAMARREVTSRQQRVRQIRPQAAQARAGTRTAI
jgi:hypothetical protein